MRSPPPYDSSFYFRTVATHFPFPLRQTGLNDGECTSQGKKNNRHTNVSVVTACDPRPQPPTYRINSQPPTVTRHRGGLNLILDHRTSDLPRQGIAAVLTLIRIVSCLSSFGFLYFNRIESLYLSLLPSIPRRIEYNRPSPFAKTYRVYSTSPFSLTSLHSFVSSLPHYYPLRNVTSLSH